MNRREFLKLCAASGVVLGLGLGEQPESVASEVIKEDFHYARPLHVFDERERIVLFQGDPPAGAEIFHFPYMDVVRLPAHMLPPTGDTAREAYLKGLQ